MRGRIYGYHWAPGAAYRRYGYGAYQCYATGRRGKYVIRQYGPQQWWAIQLFGAVGSIAGKGKTAEEALGKADENNS